MDLDDDELRFLHSVLDSAREGDAAELARLVDGGVPVNLTNQAGDSLLILAAYHDHPDSVRTLVERGADVARVNDRGQTALGAAVFRRNRTSVELLLAAGADPDQGPRSAREIAQYFELAEMADLLKTGPAAPGPPLA